MYNYECCFFDKTGNRISKSVTSSNEYHAGNLIELENKYYEIIYTIPRDTTKQSVLLIAVEIYIKSL